MEFTTRVQTLDEIIRVSLHTNSLGKALIHLYWRGSVALVRQPVYEKENWIQNSSTQLKKWHTQDPLPIIFTIGFSRVTRTYCQCIVNPVDNQTFRHGEIQGQF